MSKLFKVSQTSFCFWWSHQFYNFLFICKYHIYQELKAEHEQLSEEYHTLSIENLRLRDRVEYLQHQSNVKNEQVRTTELPCLKFFFLRTNVN